VAAPQAQPYGAPTGYDPTGAMAYAPVKKKMSGGVKALLWAIPILVVLALVGVGFALVGSKAKNNVADTTPPTTPVSSAPASTPASTPATDASTPPSTDGGSGDTFTMPSTALGLPKSTNPQFTAMLDPLTSSLGSDGKADAAVYASTSNPRNILMILGIGTDLSGATDEFQSSMFAAIGSELGGTHPKSYPAGSMGGSLQCETGSESTLKIGICSVADDGGAMIVLYFNHTGAQTAAAVLQLRSKIEKKG
jgi:hypothetical protein